MSRMKFRVFDRMLQAKKGQGKTYIVLVATKEIAVPFCYLASKNNFTIDGLIVVNQPQILPQDYSGVPIIDPQSLPFSPKLCFMIMGVPGYPLQMIWQPFVQMGFQICFSLVDDDLKEIFGALQFENFIVDTLRAELLQRYSEHVFIFESTPKAQTLNNLLKMSGIPVDGMLKTVEILSGNTLTIMPVENMQHQALVLSMTQQNAGKILPLYAGDLMAAEQYWNTHRMFSDYFDLDNVPDFAVKYETLNRRIVNAYERVNISTLPVDDDVRSATACALSFLSTDKNILHVVIPINAQGNQVNYSAGSDNFLLKKCSARIRSLTPASREFWRYFIRRQPDFVTYSLGIYDYYANRYRYETLTIEPMSQEFKSKQADEYVLFALNGNADWYEEVSARLSEKGLRAERVNQARCSAEGVALMANAKMIVSDAESDRFLALLFNVPIVLINMTSYTFDYELMVKSSKTPMLMLPKKFYHEPTKTRLMLKQVLKFEEQISDLKMRMQFYNQNGIKLLDNTATEIGDAIEEMLSRLTGSFKYSNDDEIIMRTFRLCVENSMNGRDIFDRSISIDFLRNNSALLGVLNTQRAAFAMENILPRDSLSASGGRIKIKVRAFFARHRNALRTFCEACVSDESIDLLIIVDQEDQKNQFIEDGYRCIFKDDYDVASDKPDVFFINYFNVALTIPGDIRKHSRLIIAAAQTLVPYRSDFLHYFGDGITRYAQSIERGWGQYAPDFYLFDSYNYNALKDIPFFKDKTVLEMGNPKFDGICRACRNVKSVDGWEKLDGKKIILWAVDHGALEGGMGDYVSFDVYAKHVFKYMQSHQNMGMIVRMHPLFIPEEMLKHFWTLDDLHTFKKYCAESPNVVFDKFDSYDNAFALADAIITDIDCGIRISALPTMKPICLSYRSRDVREYYEDLSDYCYAVYSPEEMSIFLDMIERGDDPLYDVRQSFAHKHVKHFDGKNGWRIKEFIKQAYYDKVNGTHTLNPL